MYGSPTSEKKLFAGLNEAKLVSFGLVKVTTSKYEGPALDIVFMVNGESRMNVRKFPISKQKIFADVAENPSRYTDDKGMVKSGQEVFDSRIENFNRYMQHIMTAFMTKEEYFAKVSEWHEAGGFVKGIHEPTFDQFVTALASMLPENYKEMEAQIKLGYEKNSEYLSIPSEMYLAGDFFSTSLNPKEISVQDTKYFKSSPWGSKIADVPPMANETEIVY
jgi:hypothetical protein